MDRERLPTSQRVVAAVVALVGVLLANPIGHALARPTAVGGPAAPIAVPMLLTILLFVALGMALIGPLMAHLPRPLEWPEWVAAVAAGLAFALSGVALFSIGAAALKPLVVLGVVLVHLAGWWYVLQWRRVAINRRSDPAGRAT